MNTKTCLGFEISATFLATSSRLAFLVKCWRDLVLHSLCFLVLNNLFDNRKLQFGFRLENFFDLSLVNFILWRLIIYSRSITLLTMNYQDI